MSKSYECLKVTGVKILKFDDNRTMLGLATVTLNDQLQIRGIRIIATPLNNITLMYSGTLFFNSDGGNTVCHPIREDLKNLIRHKVIDAYQAASK